MAVTATVEGGAQPKMKISKQAVPEPVFTAVTAGLCVAVIAEVVIDVLSVKAFTVLAVAASLSVIRILSNAHASRVEAVMECHAARMETSVKQHQEGLGRMVLAGDRANERAMRGAARATIDAIRGRSDRGFGADTGPFPVAGHGN